MGAAPGTQIWRYANPGLKPIIKTPEELWNLAVRYFSWTDANPVVVTQIHGKNSEIVEIEKPQPYSIMGFSIYTGVTNQMIDDFRKKEFFKPTMELIDDTIRKQKFDMALLGVYNANVIIRDLGLADKKQVEKTDTQKVVLYLPDNGRSIAPPKDISVTLDMPDHFEVPAPFDDFDEM